MSVYYLGLVPTVGRYVRWEVDDDATRVDVAMVRVNSPNYQPESSQG